MDLSKVGMGRFGIDDIGLPENNSVLQTRAPMETAGEQRLAQQ